jgi:hypothetical protein
LAVGVLRSRLTDDLTVIIGWSLLEAAVALAHGIGLSVIAGKLCRERSRSDAYALAHQDARRADQALAESVADLAGARERAEELSDRIAVRQEVDQQRDVVLESVRNAAAVVYATTVSDLISDKDEALDPAVATALRDYLGTLSQPATEQEGIHAA